MDFKRAILIFLVIFLSFFTIFLQHVYATVGDVNGDHVVNIRDIAILRSEYGQSCTLQMMCRADLNYDWLVNSSDYNLMKSNFGIYEPSPTPYIIPLAENQPNPAMSYFTIPPGFKSMTFHFSDSNGTNLWAPGASFNGGQFYYEQARIPCSLQNCQDVTIPIIAGNYSFGTGQVGGNVSVSVTFNEEIGARVLQLGHLVNFPLTSDSFNTDGYGTITITVGNGDYNYVALERYENGEFVEKERINCNGGAECPIQPLPLLGGTYRVVVNGGGSNGLVAAILRPNTSITPTQSPSPTPTSTPTPFPFPTGVISYWPADGNANDIVGVNDGILMNGVNFELGHAGQAFSFNRDNYIQAPSTNLPIGNNDRTLMLWVKVNSYLDLPGPSESFFTGYGNFGNTGEIYALGTSFYSPTQEHLLFFSSWGGTIFGPHLQIGEWYHVAVTNQGNNITLYLNGLPVSDGILTINTAPNTQLFLGRIPGLLGDFRKLDGLIDDVVIFNRALSPAEILSLN